MSATFLKFALCIGAAVLAGLAGFFFVTLVFAAGLREANGRDMLWLFQVGALPPAGVVFARCQKSWMQRRTNPYLILAAICVAMSPISLGFLWLIRAGLPDGQALAIYFALLVLLAALVSLLGKPVQTSPLSSQRQSEDA